MKISKSVVAVGLGGLAIGAVAGVSARSDAPAPLGPGSTRCILADGAVGDFALVNVTMVEATGPGDVRLRSSDDEPDRRMSSNNFDVGSVIPNMTIAQIGADGRICVDISPHSSVHAVIDQLATLDGSVLEPVNRRLLDTRSRGVHYDPATVCVAPGQIAMSTVSNDTLTPVQFSHWATMYRDGGPDAFKVNVDPTNPTIGTIEPGWTTTVPPTDGALLAPGESTPIAVRTPTSEGVFSVESVVVGWSLTLTVQTSSSCPAS